MEYWLDFFPGVVVRPYKSIMGKCKVCADLTKLRNTVEGRDLQTQVTELVAYHRVGYMSQRHAYYKKRHLAVTLPRLCGSAIYGKYAN